MCLDQPGFMFMMGRPCLVAQHGFMVVSMNNNVNLTLFMLYLSLNKITCVNRNGEPPGKTVLPQDIWLCLGLLISELCVRYALPDKGWGLAGSGVWTCSGVGVGLAKTRYSSGSFIRYTDQVT
jgi:hypothetical protein